MDEVLHVAPKSVDAVRLAAPNPVLLTAPKMAASRRAEGCGARSAHLSSWREAHVALGVHPPLDGKAGVDSSPVLHRLLPGCSVNLAGGSHGPSAAPDSSLGTAPAAPAAAARAADSAAWETARCGERSHQRPKATHCGDYNLWNRWENSAEAGGRAGTWHAMKALCL